jgi:hypothetical protein
MSFQVSPGVETREIDLTNVIPAVSVSVGAIAGAYNWGPVEQIVTVGSEKILADEFSTPDDRTAKYFMPAAQFLRYSNTLRVVRAQQGGMLNATPLANIEDLGSTTPILVKNAEDFETKTFSQGQEFIAKYPGELGNSIGVVLISSEAAFNDEDNVFGVQNLTAKQIFDFPPTTTEFAEREEIAGDELHIIVFDTFGLFTGVAGSILETFQGLSQASNARKSDGTNNFYKTVINERSKYIWAGATPDSIPLAGLPTTSDGLNPLVDSDDTSYIVSDNIEQFILFGGSNGDEAEPTLGELVDAYEKFRDSETVDVSFIIGVDGGMNDVTLSNLLINLAEDRRDAIAFVSPRIDRTANNTSAFENVLDFASDITSSSYGVIDSGALYVYDKYNDVFRWIVGAGDVAGLCANTDAVSDPWFSPAGFNRGQLRGVTRLAFNPIKSQRDDLYKARINPIVSFPGEGIVLFGDKTALSRPSAFDRINVRRLFIVLQKAISTAARFQLFELNDEFTRAQFRSLVEPFLRDVQGRRGVTDFKLVCDETNNTPEVIDSNRFIADIYIKPARSINFITLNFVAVRTGVEFSEITG